MFKQISMALPVMALLIGASAKADTFSINATFTDGGVATGTFTTSANLLTITSWSFSITGSPTANFSSSSATAGQAVIYQAGTYNDYFPVSAELLTFSDFSNTGNYADFYLKTALSAKGTIALTGAYDCNGCGTLSTGSVVDTSAAVPEPSAIVLLATVAGVLGFMTFRRRQWLANR